MSRECGAKLKIILSPPTRLPCIWNSFPTFADRVCAPTRVGAYREQFPQPRESARERVPQTRWRVSAEFCVPNRPARRPRRCRHYLSFLPQNHPPPVHLKSLSDLCDLCVSKKPPACPDQRRGPLGAPVSTPLDLLPIDLRFNPWIHPLWPLPSS